MRRKKSPQKVLTLIIAASMLLTSLPTTVLAAADVRNQSENIVESDVSEFTEPVIPDKLEEETNLDSIEELPTSVIEEALPNNEGQDAATDFSPSQNTPSLQIGEQVKAVGSVTMESGQKIATLTISGVGSTYNYNNDSSQNPIYNYVQKELPQTLRVLVDEGVTELGDYLFYNITELETFQLSDTVVSIGEFSFSNTGIIELSLPDTLKKCGRCAFNNCQKLKKVLNTGGLSYIPPYAFSSCPQLEEVYLSEFYAEEIGMNCFDDCRQLKSVHIPPSIYYIYEDWEYLDNVFGVGTNAAIYGVTNTFAESYANRWGFKFISEGVYETEKIPLDEAHFPDPYFRSSLKSYDYDNDGYLDIYQLQDIYSLYLNDHRIQDLTGIEYFTRLETLRLTSNDKDIKTHITKLDLSQNKEISWLDISNCLLDSLDFGDTPSLKSVDLEDSDVTDKSLQTLANIRHLTLDNVPWNSIDVTPLKAVESIQIHESNMTELDVSSSKTLRSLSIQDVPLASLTLGNGKNLKTLYLSATELPLLNLENTSALETLAIMGSTISKLDLTQCTSLKKVCLYFTDCIRSKIKLNKNQKNLDIKMTHKKYSLYVGSSFLIPIEKLDDFQYGFLTDDDVNFNGCFADLGELKQMRNSQRKTTALKVPAFEGNQKTFKIRICSSMENSGEYGKTIYELPITVHKAQANVKKPKLKALTISNYYIMKLTWNKISDANGYIVYRKKDGGKWTRLKTLSSKHTSYTDSSFKISGFPYTYTVRAFKTVKGEEVTSSYDKNGLTAIPGVPNQIIITSAKAGKSKAALTWKKDGAARGYRVYRADKKDGTYERIATLNRRSSTTFTDMNLKSGKTYYYKVRGYNKSGRFIWGKYSAIKAIKVK